MDVAEKEMTMQEMVTECKHIKRLKEMQAAFLKETGSASWEEAQLKFPSFTSVEALDEFRSCNFTQSVPTRFDTKLLLINDLILSLVY